MTLDRGDVVRLNFSPQSGREQKGWRPAMVISPAAYNALASCALFCPITSNRDPWPWKVMLPEDAPIAGAVLVDQLRSLDHAARGVTDAVWRAPTAVIDETLGKLATLTR